MKDMAPKQRRFVVVLRGPSAAILEADGHLLISGFPTALGKVDLGFRSRWITHPEGVSFPGHLWIEVAGVAPSLEEALPVFANASLAVLPVVAFGTNAAIGEPQIELGFESTAGAHEREYFQQYVAPEQKTFRFVKVLNCQLIAMLVNAVARHVDSERIRRAIGQYSLALDSWVEGRASLSLSHLWMAAEVLTKARIRYECAQRGLETQEELACALQVDLSDLDGSVRREILLQGDVECYRKAKRASDGFEHGFLGFDKIRELSGETRKRMARYVRQAILAMLDISDVERESLLKPPYDDPMGNWPVVRYLRGVLLTDQDDLASPSSEYPFMRWAPKLRKCEVTPSGEVRIQIDEECTAQLAEGVSFQPRSAEGWRPG